MGTLRLALLAAMFALVSACTSSAAIGPLRIVVPEGWNANQTGSDGLQVANGTTADDDSTTPGSATAVFDIYLNSSRSTADYRQLLEGDSVPYQTASWQIDGRHADVFTYSGPTFAGSQQAVIIPSYRLLIVYRAAFPNDEDAYTENLAAFRRSVKSIRFVAPPANPGRA